MNNRIPPAGPEGLGGHFNAERSLFAFVLIEFDAPDNVPDQINLKPIAGNVLHGLVFFKIGVENGVQNLIRRQIILVALVWL